jgi:hypothetical protein
MKQPCGCCTGIQIVTPEVEANRPGLAAIGYRAGSYATFLESMVARLANLHLDVPSRSGGEMLDHIHPLKQLTTREASDPSIALLDAWAIVADVLTFYQERIANEGYLLTATERRSVLELARLVGYRLRPGVAASVHLAFTVANGFRGEIPAGTRAQSIPGTGETAQFFETSDKLTARDIWNDLKPRLTRPQLITPSGNPGTVATTGTDATTRDTLYVSGIRTGLKTGDALLIVLGDDMAATPAQQVLRFAQHVEIQADQERTEVTLAEPLPKVDGSVANSVKNAVQPFIDEASTIFSGSGLAGQVRAILQSLLNSVGNGTSGPAAADLLRGKLQQIRDMHAIAVRRRFTRLEPWIAEVLATLNSLVEKLPSLPASGPPVELPANGPTVARSAFDNLGAILGRLALPASLQPVNSLRLERKVTQTFSDQSDALPRLLAVFHPAAAPALYQAWASTKNPSGQVLVAAARVKAALFPGTYPGEAKSVPDGHGTTTEFTLPNINTAWGALVSGTPATINPLSTIALDAVYDKIAAGSWVAIDRPVLDRDPHVTFHKVTGIHTVSMSTGTVSMSTGVSVSTGGYTARVTQLTLDPPWLQDLSSNPPQLQSDLGSSDFLHGTVVYAQTEPLDLAEEPLDRDVAGNEIELDGLYDGLEPGRWIIVQGERTDIIPDVAGVTASELVMVAAVEQRLLDPKLPGDTVHTRLKLANKLAYAYDASTVKIFGNVVKATHGQTVAEVLGNGDATRALQKFALHQSPLTYVSAATPEGAQGALAVRVNDVQWHEQDALAGPGPADRGYITESDDADQISVIFGNGKYGARLPTGAANVKSAYRYGIGKPGNVKAAQISQLATRPLGVTDVINPLRSSGGADRDSRDQARRNIPIAVMALDRLVSVKDYADFARTYAGIGKASAVRLSDGRRQVVHVTIAGVDDVPIDTSSDLFGNLVQSLQKYGDPFLPVEVTVRRVRLIVMAATVRLLPDYAWEQVAPKLRAAILTLFSFDARALAQPAFLSEAIAVAQQVEGVAWVDVTIFDSVPESVTVAELATIAAKLEQQAYIVAEPARIDQKAPPGSAERIVPAELVFMTPDIPDTLILSQSGG